MSKKYDLSIVLVIMAITALFLVIS